ncbi:hypothetical protein WMF11_04250 [Sorangium sp. So ce295]|uniref:hypothetical protein n=1 Tax=Sorangium sp. So ce295 TaxID=3133295 RepID=UPI003F6187C1
MTRPQVYLALKASGNARFVVESVSANLGDAPGAGAEYVGETDRLRIPDEFVARYIDIRVRVRTISGPAQITLYAWSSMLEDDARTPQRDERWRAIATKIVNKTSATVLEGSFDPREINL